MACTCTNVAWSDHLPVVMLAIQVRISEACVSIRLLVMQDDETALHLSAKSGYSAVSSVLIAASKDREAKIKVISLASRGNISIFQFACQ